MPMVIITGTREELPDRKALPLHHLPASRKDLRHPKALLLHHPPANRRDLQPRKALPPHHPQASRKVLHPLTDLPVHHQPASRKDRRHRKVLPHPIHLHPDHPGHHAQVAAAAEVAVAVAEEGVKFLFTLYEQRSEKIIT